MKLIFSTMGEKYTVENTTVTPKTDIGKTIEKHLRASSGFFSVSDGCWYIKAIKQIIPEKSIKIHSVQVDPEIVK